MFLIIINITSYEKNLEYVGTVQRVLVDSVTKRGGSNVYDARTLTNKLVHFETTEDAVGQFKNVKINRAGAFDLFADEI